MRAGPVFIHWPPVNSEGLLGAVGARPSGCRAARSSLRPPGRSRASMTVARGSRPSPARRPRRARRRRRRGSAPAARGRAVPAARSPSAAAPGTRSRCACAVRSPAQRLHRAEHGPGAAHRAQPRQEPAPAPPRPAMVDHPTSYTVGGGMVPRYGSRRDADRGARLRRRQPAQRREGAAAGRRRRVRDRGRGRRGGGGRARGARGRPLRAVRPPVPRGGVHRARDRLDPRRSPLLGICVGMQILYASSEEDPGAPGLGLLPGVVRRLPRGSRSRTWAGTSCTRCATTP